MLEKVRGKSCTPMLDGSLMNLVQGTPKLGPYPVVFQMSCLSFPLFQCLVAHVALDIWLEKSTGTYKLKNGHLKTVPDKQKTFNLKEKHMFQTKDQKQRNMTNRIKCQEKAREKTTEN